MPAIYYIRHGETAWNFEGKLQGRQDIPLNDLGRKQAANAGTISPACSRATVAARPRWRMLQARSAVPRPRCNGAYDAETAGRTTTPCDDRLREIGYGAWEGSTLAQMQASDPALFARRETDKWTVPPPGGESYAQVQARVTAWYNGLTADTVAVAHGGTARALMVALGVETPNSAADLTIEQGAVYVFADGALEKYS